MTQVYLHVPEADWGLVDQTFDQGPRGAAQLEIDRGQ